MSYQASAALQAAIYAQLQGDADVTGLVGAHIYDEMPTGTLPTLFVALGGEEVRDASDVTANGAWHDLTVSVISDASGFQTAKRAAGAVNDSLHEADLTLAVGQLVSLRFLKARAKRGKSGGRQIDLTFRARVDLI